MGISSTSNINNCGVISIRTLCQALSFNPAIRADTFLVVGPEAEFSVKLFGKLRIKICKNHKEEL